MKATSSYPYSSRKELDDAPETSDLLYLAVVLYGVFDLPFIDSDITTNPMLQGSLPVSLIKQGAHVAHPATFDASGFSGRATS